MRFLPIVDRELRSAARRKATFRIRSWTAFIAILISLVAVPLLWLTSGGRVPQGESLFSVLTGYAFLLCSMAGVFLTSSSLAEEKREGTLGLLFLTDLKGYDVVFGKFIGLAVNPIYALFALVPVTGLPLLFGGVTGSEFWRSTLALANVLFFSLAVGVFVSSIARESRAAFTGTFFFLIIIVYLLPALEALVPQNQYAAVPGTFAWISPGSPFFRALEANYASAPARFWITLTASNLLGWLLLGFASVLLPHSWQERAEGRGWGKTREWLNHFGSRPHRKAMRAAELMNKNPILWLASADLGSSRIVWVVVLASGVIFLSQIRFDQHSDPTPLYYSARACGFVLKLLIALQACRFFVDHRRSGALELLFSTPLTSMEIIHGQILALRRSFSRPVLIFLMLAFTPVIFNLLSVFHNIGARAAWNGIFSFGAGTAMMLWFALGLLVDVCAIVWVGMWLSLSMKKPAMSPSITILSVLIIPSIGFCGLDLVADIFLILWAVTNLRLDMRWIIARQNETWRR